MPSRNRPDLGHQSPELSTPGAHPRGHCLPQQQGGKRRSLGVLVLVTWFRLVQITGVGMH